MRTTILPKVLQVILGTALLATPSLGQTPTSSTPIIGYYKHVFTDPGAYAVVPGFISKTDFRGQATSVSVAAGQLTITQTGAGWANDQFNTFDPGSSSHYVEIISSGTPAHTGMVLDIVDNTSNTIVALVPNGFSVGTSPFTYAVRKHTTLGTLLTDSSGVSPNDDLVVVYDAAGAEYNAIYLGAGQWANADNIAQDFTNFVLYPGQGFLYVATDARTLTIGGGSVSYVKSGPFRLSVSSGVPVICGLVNPLVSSGPSDPIHNTTGRNTLLAGYSGVTESDLFITFSGDGTLSTLHNVVRSGANMLDADDASINLNAFTYPNGRAVILIPGEDNSLLLPDLHNAP